MIKRSSKIEFDCENPCTRSTVTDFLLGLPANAPFIIKTWEGYQSKVTEVQTIEFNSETNMVTIS